MEPERRLALDKTETALGYFDVLRQALDEAEGRARAIHAGIRAGERLADVFAATDAAVGRARLTDALAEYERLRHDCRLALMLLAGAEGMNKSAIARAWGISPQWAGHEVEAAHRMQDALGGPEPRPGLPDGGRRDHRRADG